MDLEKLPYPAMLYIIRNLDVNSTAKLRCSKRLKQVIEKICVYMINNRMKYSFSKLIIITAWKSQQIIDMNRVVYHMPLMIYYCCDNFVIFKKCIKLLYIAVSISNYNDFPIIRYEKLIYLNVYLRINSISDINIRHQYFEQVKHYFTDNVVFDIIGYGASRFNYFMIFKDLVREKSNMSKETLLNILKIKNKSMLMCCNINNF